MRSMVEGVRDTRCDGGGDGIGITQDIGRGDADDGQTIGRHESIARGIVPRFVAHVVRDAIDLDDQPARATEEVDHIRADRMLPAELYACLSAPQAGPEQNLRQRHRAPQSPRHRDFGPTELPGTPSTSLRLVPLPVSGRIRGSHRRHIRNTPNCARSGIGAFSVAAKARPSTSLVCAGSMMPSSHRRAVA